MKRQIDPELVKKNKADGKVHATIDGKETVVDAGLTIWEAANLLGIDVPALCHQDDRMKEGFVDLNPVGVCRLCCVEVSEPDRNGKLRPGKVLVPACMRPIEDGMAVRTVGGNVDTARKTLIELLMADHPQPCDRHREHGDCELEVWADKLGVKQVAFGRRTREKVERAKRGHFAGGIDASNPSIRVDHAACISCDRCIRACTDVKHNFVIGRMGKGGLTTISFDADQAMADSSCVNCGECMISCPTGAITYSGVTDPGPDGVDPIPGGIQPTIDILLSLDIFRGVSANFLARSLNGIKIKHFDKGEVICKQGEFGSTAFYLINGKCDVYIKTPKPASASDGGEGLLNRLASFVKVKRHDGRHGAGVGEGPAKSIPIDASTDLKVTANGERKAEINAGEIFGEMACMNFYPRSATVVAAEDEVECLEMLRNVLDLLQKNRAFREKMDRVYRERALAGHLQSIDLFAGLPKEFLDGLKDRVQLLRLRPDSVIFREGDEADSFYVVRLGHVKVSKREPWGEVVLSYLGRGQCFGEIALLGATGVLDRQMPGADGLRTATCSALDNVELVKIDKAAFKELCDAYPDVSKRLNDLAGRRLRENLRRPHRPEADAGHLRRFVEEGLFQAQSLLILDLENCTRCDECVKACADAHDGVTRMVRDGIRHGKYLIATSCRQCYDPKCMVGCPVGSIRRKNSLEILIEDWCIGCGLCASNCPYGSISMHDRTNAPADGGQQVARKKAEACDLSTELAEPACVYACPHDAAHRVNAQAFFDGRLVDTVRAADKPKVASSSRNDL